MKTVRVTPELPPEQLEALVKLSRTQGLTLEALVREAVGDLLSEHEAGSPERNLDEAFGLWQTGTGGLEDGLAYQARLRAEWK